MLNSSRGIMAGRERRDHQKQDTQRWTVEHATITIRYVICIHLHPHHHHHRHQFVDIPTND